ncbi:MAG TPA: hypothetical protein VGF79_02355 [Bacteroidia bacterium]
MKRFLQLLTIASFAFFFGSCRFAPDMEWVPEVKVTKKYTGVKKEYFESGKIKSIFNLRKDKKHGTCQTFYENGNKNMEMEYRNDRRDGAYRWYYETGELFQEGNFSDDKLHGQVTEFEKNGSIRKVKNYFLGSQM